MAQRFPFDWKIGNRIAGTSKRRALTRGHIAILAVSPLNTSATAVHAAVTLTDAVAGQDVTSGWVAGIQAKLAACPQLIEVKGNASGITGDCVIAGTDILGNAITETIALSGSSAVAGVKAFASVASVHLPAETHAGTDNVSVGVTKAFGVPYLSADQGIVLEKLSDGSADTGSFSLHASDVAQSIYTPSATPDGTKVTKLTFVVQAI